MTTLTTGAAAEVPNDHEPTKADRARVAKAIRRDFSRHNKEWNDPKNGAEPDRRKYPVDRFMRRRDVLRALGLPNSTFYELIANGEFEPGVRITKRCVAWRESYVRKWMDSRHQAPEA
jgi:prophage regulatory protein